MPLVVVVDASELADATAYLRGRRWSSLIEIEARNDVGKRQSLL